MKRFVRIGRRFGHRTRILANLFLEIAKRLLELRVFALEGSMRQIVHDDIRIHAVSFDEPFALGPIYAEFGGGSDPAIYQKIVRREPAFAAPRAHSNYLPETQAMESFGEGFAIRRSTGRIERRCGPGRRTACSRWDCRHAAASKTRPCAAISRAATNRCFPRDCGARQ